MSKTPDNTTCEREYDFALIVGGVPDLTDAVADALFEAGCDDATITVRHGRLYMEFGRVAPSLKDAILSAIQNVQRAKVGAEILRVDECDLITASEIARKIDRSRQQVHQYMTGERGPGGFPAPECYLSDNKPLWAWCAVSYWLVENDLLKPEVSWNAEVVAAINNALEDLRRYRRHPELVRELNTVFAIPTEPAA